MNPYADGRCRNVYATAIRRELHAVFVAVLDLQMDRRGYRLLATPSRAVRQGEVHELIVTAEIDGRPGGEVQSVAVVGFVEFSRGGVLVAGDDVWVGARYLGFIAGFDESHMPNHLNIVLGAPVRRSGLALGIRVEEGVLFSAWQHRGVPPARIS